MTGTRDDVIERAAIAICRQSGHAPNGTCAARCMDQLGDVPAKGCHHAKLIHGAKAEAAIRVVLEDMAASEDRIPDYPIDVRSYAFSLGIKLTKPEEADNDRS